MNLEELRERVLGDAELHRRLLGITDVETFGAILRDNDCDASDDELRNAISEARRQWLDRWV